jgi:hypothetical protein
VVIRDKEKEQDGKEVRTGKSENVQEMQAQLRMISSSHG